MIQLEDFKEELEKKEYDSIYQTLYQRVLDLLKKIAKEKDLNFQYADTMKEEEVPAKVSETFDFDYDYALFEEAGSIFYRFPWVEENESLVSEIIESYQLLEKNLKKYVEKKKEMEGKDATEIFSQVEKKFLSLYQEMMHFKKKESSTGTFSRLTEELKVFYPYFDELLTNIHIIFVNRALLHWEYLEEEFYRTYPRITLEKDPAELFVVLDNLYEELEKNYQAHAYDYPDLSMEPNETYYDIIEKVLSTYDDLFRQMLKERGVVTEKKGYPLLKELWKVYPFYEEHLGTFLLRASHLQTHLKNVFDMYRYYEKDYKENYEEKLEKYQKDKEEQMEDEDYLGEYAEDFDEVS